MNYFIKYVREGKMPGLNNSLLKEFGKKQNFYPGVVDLIKNMNKNLMESANGKNYK